MYIPKMPVLKGKPWLLQAGLWTGISSWVLPEDSAQGFIVPPELLYFSLLTTCTDIDGISLAPMVQDLQEFWVGDAQGWNSSLWFTTERSEQHQALEVPWAENGESLGECLREVLYTLAQSFVFSVFLFFLFLFPIVSLVLKKFSKQPSKVSTLFTMVTPCSLDSRRFMGMNNKQIKI